MPSIEVGSKDHASPAPAKSPSNKAKEKHDSKKRKRDVITEGVSDAVKKRKRKEKKERREKKEKAKENDKNKSGKVKVKNAGSTKKEKASKPELLVTERLCSNKNNTPGNPAIATTPSSLLKPILKSPEKMMDTTKSPLETVDSNASKANGTSLLLKSTLSKPTKPKKSVKFHSEAAAEDGESRQRIHNALIAAYKASEAAEEAAITPEELAESLQAPAKEQKAEKRKKERKEKVKKNGKDENAKQSALSYMLEYHKSRGTWRFQKAKQNWILRNVFDVTEIEGTKENDAALKAYIAGLQGQQARNRMVEEAKKILKSGEGGVEKDSGENMEVDKEKEKKMTRAKLVMIGLGHEGNKDKKNDRTDDEEEDDSEDQESGDE
ncbi:hypothetical protein BGX38DRAFT_1144557 [Terfezia claveryi]|nr:hypothetical protein BGX38DRAFT_1144557 [Terfezia claveryi]